MPRNFIREGEFSLDSTTDRGRGIKTFFVFLLLMFFSLQVTTQYIAYLFSFHPSLGRFFVAGNVRIYPFYRGISWLSTLIFQYMRTKSPEIANQTASSSMIFAFGLLATAFITRLYYTSAKSKALSALHGSAHWATQAEVIEAGLLDHNGNSFPEGVVVGGFKAGSTDKSIKMLRHFGKEHILCFAPTRSGKGVSLVLPTLLHGWKESVFVFDIKGENFALTAGYRQKELGHKILKLDFTDPSAISQRTSATFNPFAEILLDHSPEPGYVFDDSLPYVTRENGTFKETSTIQQIVAIIVDPQGKGLEDHWTKTASSFMLGAITHLLYKAQHLGEP